MNNQNKRIVIIGGGAAGFFAAIRCAETDRDAEVVILERGKEALGKVKVSGGGRCNVTHACFDAAELIKRYPRGGRELLGPFHRFGCADTVAWFEQRGVRTKTEADGRMFPVTDNSQTIMDCLWDAARKAGVKVFLQQRVDRIAPPSDQQPAWTIHTKDQTLYADKLMLATGSSTAVWEWLRELGHTIVPPVPSLFTFNIKDPRILGLEGISVPNAFTAVEGEKLNDAGPLLITHWGMSGPAILRLSAYGARLLADRNYDFHLLVNWTGQSPDAVKTALENCRKTEARKQVLPHPILGLPSRLWRSLVTAANILPEIKWADLNKLQFQALHTELSAGRFRVSGKSTFKEEFVTAGGVSLREVNFKTFESKLLPGLYFAGEVLDIDAVTGGFNFQAAWTGGWIVGEAMGDGNG